MELGVAQNMQTFEPIPKAKNHMVKERLRICEDNQIAFSHWVWPGHISYWENWEN